MNDHAQKFLDLIRICRRNSQRSDVHIASIKGGNAVSPCKVLSAGYSEIYSTSMDRRFEYVGAKKRDSELCATYRPVL